MNIVYLLFRKAFVKVFHEFFLKKHESMWAGLCCHLMNTELVEKYTQLAFNSSMSSWREMSSAILQGSIRPCALQLIYKVLGWRCRKCNYKTCRWLKNSGDSKHIRNYYLLLSIYLEVYKSQMQQLIYVLPLVFI